MWKEKAVKLLVGAVGLGFGALFVITLHGAAQSSAERLEVAQARAKAVAAAAEREPSTEIAKAASPSRTAAQ